MGDPRQTSIFHARVAADVSRRCLGSRKNAPTDVGGYTLSADYASCETSGSELPGLMHPQARKLRLSALGFRISFGFRVSDFGF